MDELALHTTTKDALHAFLQAPTHALCLVGPPGAGKGYLAQKLAAELLGKHTGEAIHNIGNGNDAITIEQIRNLQQFLRLKAPGKAAVKRVVVIENAQKMGDEAQNALLKTLEEPPADTVFILTTDGSASLRPTIYSRVQKLQVLPISQEAASKYFSASSADLTKAYHLSGGYAGLLYALLNDKEHALVSAVEQAKAIMQATPFDRLALVDSLAKQKETLPTLLYALQRVIGAILPRTTDTTRLKRLTSSMRAIYEAELDLQRSANSKLLLTDLFLHL